MKYQLIPLCLSKIKWEKVYDAIHCHHYTGNEIVYTISKGYNPKTLYHQFAYKPAIELYRNSRTEFAVIDTDIYHKNVILVFSDKKIRDEIRNKLCISLSDNIKIEENLLITHDKPTNKVWKNYLNSITDNTIDKNKAWDEYLETLAKNVGGKKIEPKLQLEFKETKKTEPKKEEPKYLIDKIEEI